MCKADSMVQELHSKGELSVQTHEGKSFTIREVKHSTWGLTGYDIVHEGKPVKKGLMMNDDKLFEWMHNLKKV